MYKAAEEDDSSCWDYIHLEAVELEILAKKEVAVIHIRLLYL